MYYKVAVISQMDLIKCILSTAGQYSIADTDI